MYVVPPGVIERGRDESASEYHFRGILHSPRNDPQPGNDPQLILGME